MYAIALRIRPTSALTFRVLPGSILDIATYPFVPPTTLSGWLRRLFWAQEGLLPPDQREGNTPRFYVLPRRYLPLGAYPVGEWRVHRTHRHGPRAFTHSEFSRLRREGKPPKGGDLQLHTWEYLLAEEFLGAVLAEKEEDLRRLQGLVGYGAKLGKEGFAYLEAVGEPLEVRLEEGDAPFTPVRAEAWGGAIQGAYPLYRFRFGEAEDPDPASPDPSPVMGYEGAYFVLPRGRGLAKGFSLEGRFFAWDLVEFLWARASGGSSS
ncbi:hypothetical protein TthHC11_20890 (plasmid) [Thermus thermophilus]|uniref:hypothetical protein n=1 Tax=Thermus thermophilus TaxID=274 RepID=UPI0011630F10|nr:hypothetical protein [Thermus thermophilus]BBL94555.1 hypothetical protein TthHC11_20890 [Thermus thermophilus]